MSIMKCSLRDEAIVPDLNRARSDCPTVESVQGNVPVKCPRRGCRLHLRCQCLAERNFPRNAFTPQDSIILNIVRLENLANRIHIENNDEVLNSTLLILSAFWTPHLRLPSGTGRHNAPNDNI
ncbi:uncharacterized protein LOC113681756 [Pocillopora damicornis]|uniref:uncharacterized protein LOC113681756 n=1 Tax=Pocillopora damicornis TaxID=46731 RepID=UPI000F54D507|nr:uncharacterized protein LOC113681756 [Pocillopora damicornis]